MQTLYKKSYRIFVRECVCVCVGGYVYDIDDVLFFMVIRSIFKLC